MPRPLLMVATIALAATVSGCSSPTPALTEGPFGTLTVVLAKESGLADAPSAYTTSVQRAHDQVVVADHAVDASAQDTALEAFAQPLEVGSYVVEVAQRGCVMKGRSCPEDPTDDGFLFNLWSCSTAVDIAEGESWQVLVTAGDDDLRTDDRRCAATPTLPAPA